MKKLKYVIFVLATILISKLSLFAAASEEGDGPWPLIFCIDNFIDNRSEANKTDDPLDKEKLMTERIGIEYAGRLLRAAPSGANCVNTGKVKKGDKATIDFWSKGFPHPPNTIAENIDVWTNAPGQKISEQITTLDGKYIIRAQFSVWTNKLDNNAGFEKIIEFHDFMISEAQ